MTLGQITFGPIQTMEEAARSAWAAQHFQSVCAGLSDPGAQLCNCRGPQPGEKQCPCALLAEMRKAAVMLEHGVTIAGRKYRLVLDDGATT